jgi:hypothetical protein
MATARVPFVGGNFKAVSGREGHERADADRFRGIRGHAARLRPRAPPTQAATWAKVQAQVDLLKTAPSWPAGALGA